jgi:two-component system sensor histidine kinase UhpB
MYCLHHLLALGRRAVAFLVGPGRTWVVLACSACLPLLLFGGWVGYLASVQTRADTSRSAAAAVDGAAGRITAELVAQLNVLRRVAASTTLDAPDLDAFRTEAERARDEQPLWGMVTLALPSGEPVLTVRSPDGDYPDPVAERPDPRRAAAAARATVGGIGPAGPVSGRRLVTLRAPVIRDGKVLFVASVALVPDGLASLLRQAGVPDDWVGVVLDGAGRTVARTSASAEAQGQLASQALRAAIATRPEGILRGRTREGVPVETLYRTLPGLGGWVVAFDIPLATLEGPVRRALVLLAGEGFAGLLLAALLTSLVARDLAQRRADEADRAARSLRASEEGRALAVEAANLGVWRWRADTDAFDGSARSLELLGAPARADGRPLRWAEATAAMEATDGTLLAQAVERCLRDAVDLDGEFRIGGAARRWVRVTGRPLDGTPLNGNPLDGNPAQRALLHGVIADISGHKQAEAERLDLLRRMALAQEDERRRIARELHDQVGQTVTGLSLGLKTLEAALAGPAFDPEVQDRLTWLRSLAAGIGQDIHRAAVDLRPAALDDFGLPSALTALGAGITERHGVAVDVQTVGVVDRLPPDVETVVYRVAQEALTNMVKHASAHVASVLLEQRAGGLRLIVEDDGIGFEPGGDSDGGPRPRLGLSGIRERLRLVNGSMQLETATGAGTTLFVQIPLAPADPA